MDYKEAYEAAMQSLKKQEDAHIISQHVGGGMSPLAKTEKGTVIKFGINVTGTDCDDVIKSSAQYSHLIRAAPELLDELTRMADDMDSLGYDVKSARDTIAKATGAA